MKILWRILLIVAFFGLVLVTKTQAQQTLSLDAFDALRATGNIKVVLEEGSSETARIDAENIPEDEIDLEVERGTLKIKLLNSVFYKNDDVRIYVTYKKLREIRALAGAEVTSRSMLTGDKLELKADSGGKITLKIEANALEGKALKGGDLSLAGTVNQQDITVAAGGFYNGLDLDCATTYVKANTGGNADVVATKYLEVSANTGGGVNYKGNPKETSFKEFMSGGVHKI